VCSQAKSTKGKQLSARNLQNRWRVAIKVLGPERVRLLSIHCGRHSFCSHALAGGRKITEVRDAAGHANISTTSIYSHAVTDDDETVGNLFEFTSREAARCDGVGAAIRHSADCQAGRSHSSTSAADSGERAR
jgi:site-specific recombinase XerD